MSPPPSRLPIPAACSGAGAAAVCRPQLHVFFDFNKSDLTPDAVKIVDQAARNATPAKATELTVTGHTDTVGSDAYNMRLSRRRANRSRPSWRRTASRPRRSRSSPRASTTCWSPPRTASASRRTGASRSSTAAACRKHRLHGMKKRRFPRKRRFAVPHPLLGRHPGEGRDPCREQRGGRWMGPGSSRDDEFKRTNFSDGRTPLL